MLNRDQKTPKAMSIFELCNAFEDQKTKQRAAARSEGRPTAGFFKTSPNDVQQRLKLNESAILQQKRRLFSSLGCLITVMRQLFLKAHRSAAAASGSSNNNTSGYGSSSELVAVLMRGSEGEVPLGLKVKTGWNLETAFRSRRKHPPTFLNLELLRGNN